MNTPLFQSLLGLSSLPVATVIQDVFSLLIYLTLVSLLQP